MNVEVMGELKELIGAAEWMLAALPENLHEQYGGYKYGCTCPRCRLVTATQKAKAAAGIRQTASSSTGTMPFYK